MGYKATKAFFYIIIAILLMMIGGVSVAMYFYITGKDDSIDYEISSGQITTSTTTIEASESTTVPTSSTDVTSTTSEVQQTTEAQSTTKQQQTTNGTTKKTTKTTAGKTTSIVYSTSTEWSTSWSSSWTMSSLIIPTTTTTTRETIISNSTYPNAIDNWEWEVLDYINAIRRKKRLPELGIVYEFRDLAERAADAWDGSNNSTPATNIIGNHAWYLAMKRGVAVSSEIFAQAFVERTPIVVESDKIHYLGVGIVKSSSGMYKMAIIYE